MPLRAAPLGRRRLRREAPPSGVRPGQLLLLSCVSILSHPVLDTLNTYGVRWLMPFSGRWFYGDTLFIVDPWLWLALGVGVFLSRRGRTTRSARVALWLAFGYAMAMAVGAVAARRIAAAELASISGAPVDRLIGVPLSDLVALPREESTTTAGERAVFRAETTGRRIDGTHFPAEMARSAFELDGRPFQVAVISDVSWRHEADQIRDRFLGVLSH